MSPGAFAASSRTLDSAVDRFVTMHMIRKSQMRRPTGPPAQPCPQRTSSTALLLENAANETAFLGHTPLTRQNREPGIPRIDTGSYRGSVP